MWSELALPWQAALEEAWESYRAGSIPIGCVILNPGGKIIARGRNRITETFPPPRQVANTELAHAELNALLSMPHLLPDRHECTLYTTMEPCPLCMGALYMSGVRGLAYACRDRYAGSANLLGATPYYARKPIRICAVPDPALEALLMGIMLCWYIENYPERGVRTVETEWVLDSPAGIALGRRLQREGTLQGLRADGVPAPDVVDALAELIE